MRRGILVSGFLALKMLSGCGGDDGGGGTAGASGQAGTGGGGQAGTGGDTVAAPFEIAPPALPVFTPCPSGWTERALDGGPTVCDPGPLPDWECPEGWTARTAAADTSQAYQVCAPPELPDTCPAGQMAVVGQEGCQPIGDACPSGDWPGGLPSGAAVVYVKAGAPAGGDGSKTAPYATLAQGVAAAKTGGVVAVARGTYAEGVSLKNRELTLWGACAAEVIIDGPAGSTSAAVFADGGKVGLRNVTLTGKSFGLVALSAKIDLRGVAVADAVTQGIHTEESTVTLDGVRVSGTRSDASKANGQGVVATGSTLNGQRVQIDASRTSGLFLDGKSTATLSEVLVDDTRTSEGAGTLGQGVWVQTGSSLDLSRSVVSRSHGNGIVVISPGSKGTLNDVVVRDTLEHKPKDDTSGAGIQVGKKAHVEGQHVVVSGNVLRGVSVSDSGTSLALSESLIEQTDPDSVGASCQSGAECTLESIALVGRSANGVQAGHAGTTVTVRDARILNTLPDVEDNASIGIGVTLGSTTVVERVFLGHNRGAAIFASGPETKLSVTDVVVEGTLDRPGAGAYGLYIDEASCQAQRLRVDGSEGAGIVARNTPDETKLTDVVITGSGLAGLPVSTGLAATGSSRLTIERVWLSGNGLSGISLGETTQVKMSDVTVLDTQSHASTHDLGIGLSVVGEANVQLDRGRFEGNRYVGILANGQLTASDLAVNSTLAEESTGQAGVGIVTNHGQLSLERVHAHKNRVAAVLVQDAGHITLKQAWLTDSQPGDFMQDYGGKADLIEGVSDGLVILDGAQGDISEATISGCKRAGVLYSSSQGTLTGVTVDGAEFGLVLRNDATPTVDESCTFDGSQQDVVPDGDLPVPNVPLKVPAPPPPASF